MNSFALLQDDVEDTEVAYDNSAAQKAPTTDAPVPAVDVRDAAVAQAPEELNGADPTAPSPDAAANTNTNTDADADADADPENAHKADQKPPKQKDLTLEEYLAKKAAMSSGLASLNIRGLRQANDGVDGFEKMSVLKKNNSPDDNSIMHEVAVKAQQQNKTIKDSTQAAVARNAEIQKFFKPDPSERRRGEYRRNYGERRGAARGRFEHRADRGRGERGRGGRGGRGAYRGAYRGGFNNRQYDNETDHHRTVNGRQDTEDVPNVDDTSAFPSL